MTNWATLFEHGAAYDVDVGDVRDTLAERRHDDESADENAVESTDGSADESPDGQRPQSDTDE